MKRIISILIGVTLLLSSYNSLYINASAELIGSEICSNISLDEFSNELNEMIEDNAALYEEASEETTDEVAVTYDGTDYSYNDFATCRLIIRSYKSYEKSYGADEAVTGYEDLQVIQYESVEETIDAFESLSSKSSVSSVIPDTEIDITTEEAAEEIQTYNWAYDRVRVYEAVEYIEENYDVDKLPEIKVGILDTGVWTEEEDIQERLVSEYTVGSSIGRTVKTSETHANIIARIITDCTTTNVKIYSYQITHMYVSNFYICEERMLQDNLDMVNFSFGSVTDYNIGAKLDAQGVLVIAGAGNEGNSHPYYPSSSKYALSVASMNKFDKLSSFSNKNSNYVEVVAPGENLPNMGSGTSYACPFVVSLCAMIASIHPEYSREEIKEALYSSCDSTLLAGTKTKYGAIDFMNALAGSSYKDDLANAPSFSLTSRPSPTIMYSEVQYLELYCNEGEEIYYTTDTSYPTRQTATLYTEPIELDVTTKIRAVTFSKNKYRSEPADLTLYIQVYKEIPDNDNGWTINSKGYVTGYYGYEINPIVPDKIFNKTVTGVAESAFENMTFIEEITLPETCEYVGNSAFKGCKYLFLINAPGVTTIGKESFSNCRSLDYINMPELSNLSKECFRKCGELNNLSAENFTIIPQYAFAGCTFAYINFPNATEVYNYAFSGCENLIEISLPSLIDECLGQGTFKDCYMLGNVELPDDFTTLGGYTFANCYITDFSFLKNIQYVYWGDFNWCQYVETMSLPSVVFVDTRTFDYMPSLKEVIIPSCTTVLEQAFRSNRYLEKVVFSDDLEYVGQEIFLNCPMMNYVVLNGLVDSPENIFLNSAINRVEFNKIQTIDYLPETQNSIIALPSTFESCSEDTTGREYKIYGTKSSTAEAWAEENGHTFYEISQENSIVTDVASVYDENSIEPLTFDAIGINSSYQWYGSLDNKVNNGDDVAIKGANSNEFTPKKGDKYPYYYCKMTSTDIDVTEKEVSTVEIYSSVCKNKLCYITEKENTEIDYVNKLIYTRETANKDFSGIINIQDNTSYSSLPSLVYKEYSWYGTGSEFVAYNGTQKERYTLIVAGDVDGDSAVDVIDAAFVALVVNNLATLEDEYFLAADTNSDGDLTVEDYAQVVNLVLAS